MLSLIFSLANWIIIQSKIRLISSTSNNIMIELPTLKSLKIICLMKYFFEFYPWDRIAKNVKERSPATLGSKIIHTLKESIDCDRNDKEDLNERPQVMS
jgi:hypothetical protein